jgi:hypothetical protein
MVIRRLLAQARDSGGKFQVATGGDSRRAWMEVTLPRRPRSSEWKAVEACRRVAREQGGRLLVRGRRVRLSFPAA